MTSQELLSVCMIVRDEAEVLRCAIESVRPLAGQIVVVDTGSTDATMDLARELGAEVYEFGWIDDFAAARNASLEHARGEWILVLDADEWIESGDLERLRELLRGPRDRVYEFPQRNYVADASTPGFHAAAAPCVWGVHAPGYVVARQIRLLPNDGRLRYRGCVHEVLEASAREAGFAIEASDLTMHHIGKLRAEAILQRKARLYQSLGEIKLEQHRDGRSLLELGVQCVELGELERAADLLGRALDCSDATGDRAKAAAHLAGVWAQRGAFDRADSLLRQRLPELSSYSFVWERWGSVLAMAGRHTRAAEVLERASRLFPDAAGIIRLLGETYLAARQFDRAQMAFERLRELGRASGLGVAGIAVARAGGGDPEPLRALLRAGNRPVATAARAGTLRWLGPQALMRAWPREAANAQDRQVLDRVLRERGRWGAAVPDHPSPSPGSLEALWRCSREQTAVDHPAFVRLATAVGLTAQFLCSVPELGPHARCEPGGSDGRTGHDVQVYGLSGR